MPDESKGAKNVYISKGATGVQGPGTTVGKIEVVQVQSHGSLPPLTEIDISALKKLAESLVRSLPGGLEVEEAVRGYNMLKELIEAAGTRDSDKQQEAVGGWTKWLGELGKKAQAVAAFAANVVALAGPWMKALNLVG